MNTLSSLLYFIGTHINTTYMVDLFYPVGSYYETSRPQSEFDPNTAWGGTWVLDSAGRVTVSRNASDTSFDVLGETGGSKNAIIPYHNHSVASSGYIANGITGGSHHHTAVGYEYTAGAGSSRRAPLQYDNPDRSGTIPTNATTHTHSLPNHTHTINYAGTSGNTTNANLQPYVVVNRWHRTA